MGNRTWLRLEVEDAFKRMQNVECAMLGGGKEPSGPGHLTPRCSGTTFQSWVEGREHTT